MGSDNRKLLKGKNGRAVTAVSRKRDTFLGALLLLVLVGIFLFYLTGGRSFHLSVPLTSDGYDDTSFLSEIKIMKDESNWLKTDNLGAPYGTDRSTLLSHYLKTDIDLLCFFFVKLTGSIGAADNLTFFTLIFLIALVSYLVLRSRKIDLFFSVAGALSFAFLPYLFFRNELHLMLSAYYCVPLSILLCVWIYEDDGFLCRMQGGSLKAEAFPDTKREEAAEIGEELPAAPGRPAAKGGFMRYRRNWLAVLFAGLIALNGIGYYPFFTCFFLMVAGLSKSLKDRSLRGLIQALRQIGLIICFLLAEISGWLVSWLRAGRPAMVQERTIGGVEIYALKIARLFIPVFGSGISRLDHLLDSYKSVEYANTVTESSEYLGLIGTVGLFFLLLIFLLRFERKSKYGVLTLLSEMNIAALLYGTMGGLNVFVTLFLTASVRCTNRISVFIAFISIYGFCAVMSSWAKELRAGERKRASVRTLLGLAAIYGLSLFLLAASLWLQTRGQSFRNEETSVRYAQEQEFVERIEKKMPDGSMIFELPYFIYPEGGRRVNMNSDEQFLGYLHSTSLRWSYGALPYEKASILNQRLSEREPEKMLRKLRKHGFSGIYINSKGYTTDEFLVLSGTIENLTETKPLVSEDGYLYFYDISGLQQDESSDG